MTSIIILNYNNGSKTAGCISSVLNQSSRDYRILIVDNGSTDNSLDIIQDFLARNHMQCILTGTNVEEFLWKEDEVILMKSDKNGGYSYGNNLGIRLAKSMKIFSHFMVINNDVVLDKECLKTMVHRYEELRQQDPTGNIALGATELAKDGKKFHAGFHYLNLPTGITYSVPRYPSFKYIPGSLVFTTIDAPLMDEKFFLYFDDIRYSKILRKNGFIMESNPGSIYTHEVGGTPRKNRQWQIFRSLCRFYSLHYPLLLPVIVPLRLLLILYLFTKSLKS